MYQPLWVKKKDFIETNNGNVRLGPNAVKLLLNELGKLLGMRVMYKKKKALVVNYN